MRNGDRLVSWTPEQYELIKFQQLHRFDAFANPDHPSPGMGRCGCGVDMFWSEFHPHFAAELLALGWRAPDTVEST